MYEFNVALFYFQDFYHLKKMYVLSLFLLNIILRYILIIFINVVDILLNEWVIFFSLYIYKYKKQFAKNTTKFKTILIGMSILNMYTKKTEKIFFHLINFLKKFDTTCYSSWNKKSISYNL